MTIQRILIATDVPFWRQSTGAEQRINSLVQCLHNHDFLVEIFYIAGTDSCDLENDLLTRSQSSWLAKQVKFYRSSDPPAGTLSRIAWHLKGAWHWLSAKPDTTGTREQPPRLTDFNWPWAQSAFETAVARFQPDAVVVEYAKLAYLLDAKSVIGDRAPATILDSHDLLFRRCESFSARGQTHWIEISECEEANVFQRFDTVIAIQKHEAKKIKEMAPRTQVIVCTHACYPSGLHPDVNQSPSRAPEWPLRLGILSSDNPANRSAILSFISEIWGVKLGGRADVCLLVAGSVCDGICVANRTLFKNIRLSREIDSPSTFYKQVDVVVNPIEFGSGLKIKNVEALAHGKPLITTPHGATGFVDAPTDGVFIADNAQQWLDAVDQLVADDELQRLSEAVKSLSQERFSEAAAYRDLLKKLRPQDA